MGLDGSQFEQRHVKYVRDSKTNGQSVSVPTEHKPTTRARECTQQRLQSHFAFRSQSFQGRRAHTHKTHLLLSYNSQTKNFVFQFASLVEYNPLVAVKMILAYQESESYDLSP